jgi:hypothetical protein
MPSELENFFDNLVIFDVHIVLVCSLVVIAALVFRTLAERNANASGVYWAHNVGAAFAFVMWLVTLTEFLGFSSVPPSSPWVGVLAGIWFPLTMISALLKPNRPERRS